MLEDVRRT